MNLQDVITPVAKFIEWTFETFLVPASDPFNLAVIVLGFAGLGLWLRKQRQYSDEARRSGGII